MAEERKIPTGIIVGGGVAAAVITGTLIYYFATRAKPPPPPPPGLATLYGKVTDAVTGGPIPGVLVTLNGLQVYTDSGGYYAFTDLEPGEYALQFSKAGYETALY